MLFVRLTTKGETMDVQGVMTSHTSGFRKQHHAYRQGEFTAISPVVAQEASAAPDISAAEAAQGIRQRGIECRPCGVHGWIVRGVLTTPDGVKEFYRAIEHIYPDRDIP